MIPNGKENRRETGISLDMVLGVEGSAEAEFVYRCWCALQYNYRTLNDHLDTPLYPFIIDADRMMCARMGSENQLSYYMSTC